MTEIGQRNGRLLPGRVVIVGLVACALGVGGCASGGGGGGAADSAGLMTGRWSVSSRPSFAVIDRESLMALVHSNETDALVYEQREEYGKALAKPRVWVIVLPQTARRNVALEVGEASGVRAWAIASFDGAASRAIPALGRVAVLSSDGDGLTAQVNLEASGPAPTAGMSASRRVSLDGRVVFERSAPATAAAPAPATTSGVTAPIRRKR